jgi:hypothetical protein
MIIQKSALRGRTRFALSYCDAYAGFADLATLACCGFDFFAGLGPAGLAGFDALVTPAAFI